MGQQLADVMEPVGQHMHLANLMNASGMFRPQMTEKSNVVDDASQAHSLLANAPAHRSSDAFEKQRAKHESSELVPKDVHQIQEEISKIIEDTAEIVYQKRNEIQQNVENDISERFLTGNNGSASDREKAAEPQNYISGGTQQNYDANVS